MTDGRTKSPCGRKKTPKKRGRPKGSKNLQTKLKGLTELDLKIRDNLLNNDEFIKLNVTQRAEYLGCSRRSYYNALAKPEVQNALYKGNMSMLAGNSKALLESCLKFALTEKRNQSDRRMLLEMLGYYKPKPDISINNTIEQRSNPFEGLSLEELKSLAAMNMNVIEVDYQEE